VHWRTRGKDALPLDAVVARRLPRPTVVPCYVLGRYAGMACCSYSIAAPISTRTGPGCISWHYEYHMSGNVEANGCITWPWFDWIVDIRRHADEAAVP